MSAEVRAADKRQVIQAGNVRRNKGCGQKASNSGCKCPQKQGQRTKGKRMKVQMSADTKSADKKQVIEVGNVRRSKVSGQKASASG
ncbi:MULTISPECIES: hypothetical protein [Bacillaceae]|uniref:Uncharacterized protein n=1 Tax=Evansella alkalicola TaxID=745819 RepID=A0ABS6JV11_9BACI|nr:MULTISPECIES: hypothetical protein [Bacillaceae]MBU9722409.1 hypothetical protein [Bacillus alkalicola]